MKLTPLITATLGQGVKANPASPGAEAGAFAHGLAKANRPTDEKPNLPTDGKAPGQADAPPTPFDTASGLQGRASLAVMRQALGEEASPDGKDAGLREIAQRLVLIETAGRDAALGIDNSLTTGAQKSLAAWQLGDRDSTATVSLEPVTQPEIAPEALILTETDAMTVMNGDHLSPVIPAQQTPPVEMTRNARLDSLPEAHQARGGALNARSLSQGAQPVSAEALRATTEAGLARTAEPLAGNQAWPTQESTRMPNHRGESVLSEMPGTGLGVQSAGTQGNGLTGAGATPPSVSAPINSPAWPQQVGQQLMALFQRGGEQRVELHLNPTELGPLSISLKMNEQAAQLQFLSAHAQVRSAVEQAIPQLREALAEQGIQLGEASVGEQHQQPGRDFAGSSKPGSLSSQAGDDAGEASLASEIATTADSLVDGRVDLYA